MTYSIFHNGKLIRTGTMTECIDRIACLMNQFHPEMVTARDAVAAGYQSTWE